MRISTLFAAVLATAMSVSAGEVTEIQTAVMGWNESTPSHVNFAESDTEGESDNHLDWANGFALQLGRNDKAYASAKDITVNGENIKTIKLSNGAANYITAPEGYVITNLTLYSYINFDRVAKGKEGRVCYWAQIGDKNFTKEEPNADGTGVTVVPADDATILKDYSDIEGYQENPDKVSVAINNQKTVMFKNTGEQLCFVMEVTFGKGEPESGINDIIANPVVEDGVMYNLQGIRVDESYRGIVIMNGKKYQKN